MLAEPWSIVTLGLLVACLVYAAFETLSDWADGSKHMIISGLTMIAYICCVVIQLGNIHAEYGILLIVLAIGLGIIGGGILFFFIMN